jgi:hypothetical protein
MSRRPRRQRGTDGRGRSHDHGLCVVRTLLKTSMVRVYSSSRFVLQLGDERSILPLRGKETSSLDCQRRVRRVESLFRQATGSDTGEERAHSQDVYPRVVEHLHALVMVVRRVDRVDPHGVDAELAEVRQIARAVLRRRQWVDVRGWFGEASTACELTTG